MEGMVSGFLAGKSLLTDQGIEVHSLLVDGDRVAVQSTWTGVVGHDVGFAAGTRLTAHMAGFLTVRDGLVVRHETYDCYEAFGQPPSGEPRYAAGAPRGAPRHTRRQALLANQGWCRSR